MAAAVADYRAASVAANKIKREGGRFTLELVPTTDILAEVKGPFLKVGFAAESRDLIKNAEKKLEKKKLDMIVANNIAGEDPVFGSDNNQVTLLKKGGQTTSLPTLPKRVVADKILDEVVALLLEREKSH